MDALRPASLDRWLAGPVTGCPCGREHRVPIREVLVGGGALDAAPELVRRHTGAAGPLLLVADPDTWDAAGSRVAADLRVEGCGVRVALLPRGPHADDTTIDSLVPALGCAPATDRRGRLGDDQRPGQGPRRARGSAPAHRRDRRVDERLHLGHRRADGRRPEGDAPGAAGGPPNEPLDLAFIPTMGHALALGFQAKDPRRVGALMESAHAILAGLDPSDEIGFAMTFGKLWSVHLHDQTG